MTLHSSATVQGISGRPIPGPVPHFRLPPIFRHTLGNGLRVWVAERHGTPQVVASLVVPSGSTLDPPGKSGAATLAAELLDAGTPSRTALEIAENVEFLGATLTFRGGPDGTMGMLLTLGRHFANALDLFADAAVNPLFPAGEFDRVRGRRLTFLAQQRDRPAWIAANAIMRLLYGGKHPYGLDPAGDVSSLGGLTRDDVEGWYREQIGPRDATLIVVGDVSAEKTLPLIERAFGAWRSSSSGGAGSFPPPAGTRGGVYLIDRPGSAQAEIRIGCVALPRGGREYFPAILLNRVLGGQFSSRINLSLRERHGYTYGARSSFLFLKHPGPFLISGGVTSSKASDAAEKLIAEVEAVHRDGITAEELEFSRRGLLGTFDIGFETPMQVAGALQGVALYGLGDDYIDRYTGEIESVTLEGVKETARRWLDPSAMTLLVVGDAREAGRGLENLARGPVVNIEAGGPFPGEQS